MAAPKNHTKMRFTIEAWVKNTSENIDLVDALENSPFVSMQKVRVIKIEEIIKND